MDMGGAGQGEGMVMTCGKSSGLADKGPDMVSTKSSQMTLLMAEFSGHLSPWKEP